MLAAMQHAFGVAAAVAEVLEGCSACDPGQYGFTTAEERAACQNHPQVSLAPLHKGRAAALAAQSRNARAAALERGRGAGISGRSTEAAAREGALNVQMEGFRKSTATWRRYKSAPHSSAMAKHLPGPPRRSRPNAELQND